MGQTAYKAFPWGKVARRKHPQGVRRIRKAAKLPTTAQPMTDEGDHGGAPVIDGPLGTAAPTKSIVTLRRGGCPHPPVQWPSHPRYPPSSAPCGGTFPLEGGRLRDVGSESFRHGCAAVGSFAALRMRRTPCGCCAPRNDRKGFIDTLKKRKERLRAPSAFLG